MTSASSLALAEPILWVPVLVRDRPRAIDRVIDYFGESPRTPPVRPPDTIETSERG